MFDSLKRLFDREPGPVAGDTVIVPADGKHGRNALQIVDVSSAIATVYVRIHSVRLGIRRSILERTVEHSEGLPRQWHLRTDTEEGSNILRILGNA